MVAYDVKSGSEWRTETDFDIKRGELVKRNVRFYYVRAAARVTPRIIEVETACSVPGSNAELSKTYTDEDRKEVDVRSPTSVLSRAVSSVCGEFAKRTCGYTAREYVAFVKATSKDKRTRKQNKRALNLVKGDDLEEFADILERDPDDAAALADRALILALRRDLDEAIDLATRALRRDPENSAVRGAKQWIERQ